MRPLSLHTSALNDAEYDLYTSSLKDLALVDDKPDNGLRPDDSYYDHLSVGVREARAWLRGRYSSMDPHLIDSILRLFSPSLAQSDALTGGQFFAMLRLVAHVLNGAEIDKNLVFVQVQPNLLPSSSFESEPRDTTQLFSLPSDPPTSDVNPFHLHAAASIPDGLPQRTAPPPFPSQSQGGLSPPIPPKTNTNPFLINKANASQNTPRSREVDPASSTRLPPLPPRKPVIPPPPPRHSSQAQQPPPVVPINSTQRPVPTPPTHSNLLIQQSLQATRVAQSLKRAEQRLEQERVLEVLKSSNTRPPSNGQRMRSTSPAKERTSSTSASSTPSASSSVERRPAARPQLPPRRNLSPAASTAGSSRSFEQVAYATVSRASTMTAVPQSAPPLHSPSSTPPRPLTELPPDPPPTHPDRKSPASAFAALDLGRSRGSPSPTTMAPGSPTGSSSPRVFRSRSMHYPSGPPVPPPSRRRPDSFQISPSSATIGRDLGEPDSLSSVRSETPISARSAPPHNPSRHVSTSFQGRERDRSPPLTSGPTIPLSQIQKAFSDLQQKAQPRLDAARFKAEAGLLKRGFVRHGGSDRRWREDGDTRLVGSEMEESEESGVEVDPDEESFDTKVAKFNAGTQGTSKDDRDEMKWPPGEGWRPL